MLRDSGRSSYHLFESKVVPRLPVRLCKKRGGISEVVGKIFSDGDIIDEIWLEANGRTMNIGALHHLDNALYKGFYIFEEINPPYLSNLCYEEYKSILANAEKTLATKSRLFILFRQEDVELIESTHVSVAHSLWLG